MSWPAAQTLRKLLEASQAVADMYTSIERALARNMTHDGVAYMPADAQLANIVCPYYFSAL